MIAMAMACNPAILIADEPTTALDVTVQARMLQLIDHLRRDHGTAVLFITHDLGVVAEIADRILVMYRGRVVEQGPVLDIFTRPQHPYTKGLLACRPKLSVGQKRLPVVADFMQEDADGGFSATDASRGEATQLLAAELGVADHEASQNGTETTKMFPVEHANVPRPADTPVNLEAAPLESGQLLPEPSGTTNPPEGFVVPLSLPEPPAPTAPVAAPGTADFVSSNNKSATSATHGAGPPISAGASFNDSGTTKPAAIRSTTPTSIQYPKTPSPQDPILAVKNLHVHFPISKGFFRRSTEFVRAVDGVSFDIYPGETVGLVGESGCGKTTLGRALLRLVEPTSGSILFEGIDLATLPAGELRRRRREFQMVFQDPYAALNPMMTVGEAILEPMRVHGVGGSRAAQKAKVLELLQTVGLSETHFQRYPHEFSGGQRQRICIARALALQPKCIICDESVSALDVSVQAQVLNLLNDLKREFGITYLFITHDLSVARFMADRLLVMSKGKIVESGPAAEVYAHPQNDYTKTLLAAIPKDEPADIRAAVASRR